jgi:hypothetical protein
MGTTDHWISGHFESDPGGCEDCAWDSREGRLLERGTAISLAHERFAVLASAGIAGFVGSVYDRLADRIYLLVFLANRDPSPNGCLWIELDRATADERPSECCDLAQRMADYRWLLPSRCAP